ncbi:syringate O-demethylase [Alteraurantiacibacter aquimixticola]|uniref:Aminomethyl transferase family protein n=1 Tax=Alteraurantiacibacter aquimixticola TaxID=2489173 RepID=A0A4T3F0W8_9SPHN|nr:aminomethyltransferase family protein [Alteraurantiacibacter aquimixticola]TIX49567.1 aminomethyl transferase family protein [Alteraurantiacibacter aquimixticola]
MSNNLQSKLDAQSNVVDFLRNQQVGPNVYPGVPAEYSNWRKEQRGWAKSAVLFNQSYHMVELYVRGPEAMALLEYTAINSFKNFAVNKAKQYVPVTPDGYVIGDVILFYLDENEFSLVGRAPAIEWVEFHAQYPKPDGSKWNVTVERDERTAMRTDGVRKNYRFQLQGPNAMSILEKAMGQTPPDLKFFNMAHVGINGKDVIALRHGMAGQPGYELFGPWADYEAVHSALVEAGKGFGLELVGGRAYSSNTLESGWLPSPLPAFYTGDSQMMKDFRAWSSDKSYAGMCSIGGSYVPDSIEGYYLTPWDIGYGHIVKFDHDFVGREALEKMANQKHKQKVTLALDNEDMMRVLSSLYAEGDRAKYFEFPSAVYAMHPFDEVRTKDGKFIGVSTWVGYSSNEGKMLTLAMIDPDEVEMGKEVKLVWGEPNGGTTKPTVEPHVQTEITAVISPVPYSNVARTAYADSWRAEGVGKNV